MYAVGIWQAHGGHMAGKVAHSGHTAGKMGRLGAQWARWASANADTSKEFSKVTATVGVLIHLYQHLIFSNF